MTGAIGLRTITSGFVWLSLALSSTACRSKPATIGAITTPASRPASQPATKPVPNALYHRLGGEPAIRYIVDEFMVRVAVNRKLNVVCDTVKPEHLPEIKRHLVAFLVFSTGGPKIDTGGMTTADALAMQLTGEQFDAMLAELKVSLVTLNVAPREQSELLTLAAGFRPAILSQNAK